LQPQEHKSAADFEAAYGAERDHLVAICAYLSGEIDAAEDLAQETLLEAWRHENNLRDPKRRRQWLVGIARNVCLRWARRRKSRVTELTRSPDYQAADQVEILDTIADDFNLEVELERSELAELLDRAMTLLPPDTRKALIARYVGGFPYSEVAAQLNSNETAVRSQVYRGKLVLRRLLSTDLRDEAASYGLVASAAESWQETRIWCPVCGTRRLDCHLDRTNRAARFRCPDCCAQADDNLFATTKLSRVDDVRSYKPILSRILVETSKDLQKIFSDPDKGCPRCQHRVDLEVLDTDVSQRPIFGFPCIRVRCVTCAATTFATYRGLAMTLPEVQTFWRAHARIRMLPEQDIYAQGRPALKLRFESLRSAAALDVISILDPLPTLQVHADTAQFAYGGSR